MERRKRFEKFCVDLPWIDWLTMSGATVCKEEMTRPYIVYSLEGNLYDETYRNPKLKRYKYFILQVRSIILALNPQSDHFLCPKILKWIDRFHTSSNTGETKFSHSSNSPPKLESEEDATGLIISLRRFCFFTGGDIQQPRALIAIRFT